MEELKVKKRLRDDLEESELEIDSPEVKRLRENLLNSFDDDAELCTMSPDLDSFMKGFEEEINASSPAISAGEADQVVDLSSDSGESRTDLGYLLEASDDELGLPPTALSPGGIESQISTELVRVESDSSDLGNYFWEMPDYDSFGFEFGESETNFNNGGMGEYVALDGLFDYSDICFGSGDFHWRPGTLPAQ